MPTTVIGIPLSPFVRKVIITLEMLNVEHSVNPVTPMSKPDNFLEISPLGMIPAFQNDEITVSDSSVICSYLDAKYGPHKIYPADLIQRTKALWYEEYADTKMAELCGGLFFQRVIKPVFLQQETDQKVVDTIINKDLPAALNYLEGVAPSVGFMVGDFSIADIGIGTHLLNAKYAKWEVDAARWPIFAAYAVRVLGHAAFQKRMAADAEMMKA